MPGKLNVFNLGSLGVDVVASPLHIPDGAWTQAQNAEFPSTLGQGGIKKRGSLSRINSVALAGAVQALVNAPFPLYAEQDLMVGLNAGEASTWKKSVDGTTYTNLTSGTIERCSGIGQFPTNASSVFFGQRAISYKNQFYFPGDNYTVNATAALIVNFNGVLSFEQFRIPQNPTSAGPCRGVLDMWIDNNMIYMAVADPGGVAPDQKGRVLAYDPSNGVLSEVGNRFGNGASENPAGYPFCLTSYLGYIWAGTYGVSGNNRGKLYRIQPGVDDTWTLDLYATLHNGYFMTLCPYNGVLYAGTDADASGTAIVQARTSAGVWSTSFTAPVAGVSYFGGLIVFNSKLYVMWTDGGATSTLIKQYDGTSWTTDLDVAATYSLKVGGAPFLFRGNLYWPFLGTPTSDTNLTGFLLKRTPGGVWSKVLDGFGIRGGLGQFIPAP